MSGSSSLKGNKKFIALVFALVVFSVIALYFGVSRQHAPTPAQIDGFTLAEANDISDFTLTDNGGQVFNKQSLKGHWTMMFFGFTNCGMVCPTTLSALNQMYQTLTAELPPEMLPQVVMVTVDPERDTVDRMNEYVTSFNPHFIGARADLAQIQSLEEEFHLTAEKVQAGEAKNQYTVNHSAEILVINPEGKLQAFMSYPHKPDQMVKDYKLLLSTMKA